MDNAVHREVPLPGSLFTDAALYRRLLRRAELEATKSFCPCTYKGLQVKPGVFEPDPAKWEVKGWKTHQKIYVEFDHIRDADTGKRHRVCVYANNWLDRGSSTPGHPLNITAARRLRFSIEFLDAFADNKLKGMKFCGVCYDTSERPEVLR